VVSVYAGCPDITRKVTPDLKEAEGSHLVYIPFNSTKCARLGGSALAQCFSQIGDTSPDLEHIETFVSAFEVTQTLIKGLPSFYPCILTALVRKRFILECRKENPCWA
jgi:phosphoribosylformylglycinamidine synthase